jgi:hypothetical protein
VPRNPWSMNKFFIGIIDKIKYAESSFLSIQNERGEKFDSYP